MLDKTSVEIKPGSETSFGYVFACVFVLLGLYSLRNGGEFGLWLLGMSGLLLLITWIRPSLFAKPNYLWFRFGLILGAIVAPIVMAVVYLITIVPLGLIMKALNKDLLRLRLDKNAESYWIERDTPLQSMKNQF